MSTRIFIMHATEMVIVWPALVMMNETEDGKLPEWKKLCIAMLVNYTTSLFVNYLIQVADHSAIGVLAVSNMLLSLLFCCAIFTGGVVKILLSLIISDMWCGVGEILMTIIYCLICGKKLEFIFLPQYEGNIFLQWIVELTVGMLWLFITRPLFHKYKKLSIFENRIFTIAILFYFVIGEIWSVRPVGMFGGNVSPYYYTLIFIAVFTCIFIMLLGYNQRQMLQIKIQSLYLQQKMEQEYELVFQDMDKNVRCFRHDVKKHLDHLAYMADKDTASVPVEKLEEYQKELKAIYEELLWGNYCGQYDVNMILAQLEKDCREQNQKMEMEISLKDLDFDSLSAYVRARMLEIVSDWVRQEVGVLEAGTLGMSEMPKVRREYKLTLSGTSSAGFHSLKVELLWNGETNGEQHANAKGKGSDKEQCANEREVGVEQRASGKKNGWNKKVKFMKNIKKYLLFKKMTGSLKKLLKGYHALIKSEKRNGGVTFFICWHGDSGDAQMT